MKKGNSPGKKCLTIKIGVGENLAIIFRENGSRKQSGDSVVGATNGLLRNSRVRVVTALLQRSRLAAFDETRGRG